WERGGACLQRAGLFERVSATAPAFEGLRFDTGEVVFKGAPPAVDDVSTAHAPRRTVLDKILVDAAVAAGAEVRENFAVLALLYEDDGVSAIVGHAAAGVTVREKGGIVIGADGKNSLVAGAVKAAEYNIRPAVSCWYYTYWSGTGQKAATWYAR